MAPIFTLNQVSKVFANGTEALRSIDLSVHSREFISLVGPSGCGKSTILRLIAGLGRPSGGNIFWGPAPEQRNLAFVFQDAALMPWASVLDNVHLPLKLKGKSLRAARAAIAQSLQMVGLQGLEDRYPRQLSGGMKMRVSIARALITQPNILLMDEPFGALDEMTRSKLNSDLLDLWAQQQWTVVFVTHNIYEAVYLSSRVVVLGAHPGQVVADIPIEAPYPRRDHYRTSPLFNRYCREILDCLSGTGMSSANP
ncbi:nitrate/sulfonate/bicarbonate ABC transporter ATP-binding protein [filamentous cyanobacterium CCP5]|nr:nitrate/sulfonate/bicarbonate ABC transporter ATP-binding protein [filamentous cyanobacterium CCP5]